MTKTGAISYELPLEEFQSIILSTLSIEDLYIVQIELQKKIGRLYQDVESNRGKQIGDNMKYKMDLNWAKSLQDVCLKRQQDLTYRKVDYIFHTTAKKILDPTTYENLTKEVMKAM